MADLIDLETYKQAKAITGHEDDERISELIPAVSQLVKTYCGNSFVDYVSTEKTEYFTTRAYHEMLFLQETPVISITSVEYKDTFTDDYTLMVEDTDFVVDTELSGLRRVGYYWPVGINAIKVVYTAGYTTLPTDLALACCDLVHYYMKDEYKTQQSVTSYIVTNTSRSSMDNSIDLPDHIRRVLDMHRYL